MCSIDLYTNIAFSSSSDSFPGGNKYPSRSVFIYVYIFTLCFRMKKNTRRRMGDSSINITCFTYFINCCVCRSIARKLVTSVKLISGTLRILVREFRASIGSVRLKRLISSTSQLCRQNTLVGKMNSSTDNARYNELP